LQHQFISKDFDIDSWLDSSWLEEAGLSPSLKSVAV
jgi:hypothetical protein